MSRSDERWVMLPHTSPGGEARGDPRTFADHGVPDARLLYRAVERGLDTPVGTTVRVGVLPLGVVAAAYREAFRSVDDRVPADVEAALSDAVACTAEQFGGRHARVREELLPAFYAHFVGFHAAYHGSVDPVVVS